MLSYMRRVEGTASAITRPAMASAAISSSRENPLAHREPGRAALRLTVALPVAHILVFAVTTRRAVLTVGENINLAMLTR